MPSQFKSSYEFAFIRICLQNSLEMENRTWSKPGRADRKAGAPHRFQAWSALSSQRTLTQLPILSSTGENNTTRKLLGKRCRAPLLPPGGFVGSEARWPAKVLPHQLPPPLTSIRTSINDAIQVFPGVFQHPRPYFCFYPILEVIWLTSELRYTKTFSPVLSHEPSLGQGISFARPARLPQVTRYCQLLRSVPA